MEKMRELLAGCLRESPDGYVVQSLIEEFPTVQSLMSADVMELKSIKGVGIVKAKQLNAIINFVRAVNAPDVGKRVIIRSPKDIFDFVRAELEFLDVEKYMVVGLNTKNHVIFKEAVSSGSLNASIVHPRETFKNLIKRAAASCILVHNHPSGDSTPSQEDIALTKKLVECGRLLDIHVLDHVIVGSSGKYASLKEVGYI